MPRPDTRALRVSGLPGELPKGPGPQAFQPSAQSTQDGAASFGQHQGGHMPSAPVPGQVQPGQAQPTARYSPVPSDGPQPSYGYGGPAGAPGYQPQDPQGPGAPQHGHFGQPGQQQPQQPQQQHVPAARPQSASQPQASSQPDSGKGARLVLVRRDGSDGQTYPLVGGSLDIGRTQGHVQFQNDSFVSPLHLRVSAIGNSLQVQDLDSRNGVFVRIAGAQGVYPGDMFLLGHQLLRLENLPDTVEEGPDGQGVRPFGTPLDPAWGRVAQVGVGNIPGNVYYLRGSSVIFGREQGDLIFPRDAFLSRQHARLRMRLDGGRMSVVLEDLESANGTYLRLRGHATLHSGDMLRVGDQIFRVRI